MRFCAIVAHAKLLAVTGEIGVCPLCAGLKLAEKDRRANPGWRKAKEPTYEEVEEEPEPSAARAPRDPLQVDPGYYA
ncbi:MAG: hypothetical protein JSV86_19865 [Gemmatimonadota bacterium]|nr:MAG: hypothetical protein JSV86_19865 [Gemmatimonadota bacterium]